MVAAFVFSCKNKPAEIIETKSELIEITKAQFQSENMEFGKPGISAFTELVHFTGNVVPSVDGQAQISVPVQGLINRIYCKPGQMVNKGGLLFDISGNEFVDMQREFAESAAMVKRLKADYERVRDLSDENIGTIKDFIFAESAYNAENAKLNALVIKLQNIGLDVSKIEEGTFYTSYSLKAPIKGYVNQVNTTIGQHVQPQQTIAEIIDTESFQLKLSVFEKDIYKIETGQKVEFFSAGNNTDKNVAKLISVGKSINGNTMSIDCLAEIENLKSIQLVSNQYIEGEIVVSADSMFSLPQSAIVSSENENFVLVFERESDEIIFLKKMVIKTGRINNDFVEVSDILDSKRVLVNGIYNIQFE